MPLTFGLWLGERMPKVRYRAEFSGLSVTIKQRDRPAFVAAPASGVLLGNEEGFRLDGVSGSDVEALGQFDRLLGELRNARVAFAIPRTLMAWSQWLLELIDALRDHGWRYLQLASNAREAAEPRDSQKCPKVQQTVNARSPCATCHRHRADLLNLRKLIAPYSTFCPAGFDGTFFYRRGKVGRLLRNKCRFEVRTGGRCL